MNKSCDLDRRVFLRSIGYGAITVAAAAWTRDVHGASRKGSGEKLPNILLLLADDWSYPHAGALGDEVVKTPMFDRIAGEGVLFENAFVSAPSCTPSRGAILTGQYHWRLGSAMNLWGSLPKECRVYTSLLETIGYHTGCTRKAFAPTKNIGWDRNPAGPKFKNFKEFMAMPLGLVGHVSPRLSLARCGIFLVVPGFVSTGYRGRHNCIWESFTFIESTSHSAIVASSANSNFCWRLPLSASKTFSVLRHVSSCDEVISPRYRTVR